jgi:hypothetical protein
LHDDSVIVGALAFGIEFVLETGAAAAFDAYTQHGTGGLLTQDFADSPRCALSDGDIGAWVGAHLLSLSQSARLQG